jgi:alkylation response protein AidB-like acyl-CoA dehydrogenase
MSGLELAMAKVDKIADLIRDDAAVAERQGFLTPAVVDALFEADLFRLMVPAADGGFDLTIPESIEVFERLASFDASTAWTIAILTGGPRIARLISPEVDAAVHGGRGGLMAATLNPIGARAIRVDGGFRFSGTGSYMSGSAHADWLMVSALEIENDAPVFNNGVIAVRSGVIPIDHARLLDTWHVTGMRATNSTDCEFNDVFVADGWHFKPLELGTSPETAFDAIPLWAKLGPALAACGVGAARNMIERFVDLAGAKMPAGGVALLRDKPTAQIALGEAQSLYQAARAVLLETTREVWALGIARAPFDNEILARHRLGLVAAVRLSAQAIDLLHDASGMSAVASDSVLERCWRDVHTITQHLVLSPARYEIAGRVLLGLDPGAPVI